MICNLESKYYYEKEILKKMLKRQSELTNMINGALATSMCNAVIFYFFFF